MRVILKPGGLIFLLIAITALAIIAFSKTHTSTGGGPEKTGGPDLSSPTAAGNDEGHSEAVADPSKRRAGELIDPVSQHWSLGVQDPARARIDYFLASDLPGSEDKHALRFDILAVDPNKYWAAQLIKVIPDPVPLGHHVIVHFWARSKTSNTAHIVFEEGKPPHTPQLSQVVSFTPTWKKYDFPFITTKDNTAVHANFCVKASVTPGEIEIAQLYLQDDGAAK